MRQYTRVIGWMVAVLLLSVGFVEAQTNTLSFDNGACSTLSNCSKGTPLVGTNFVQIDGAHFFFYENTTIGGQALTHLIIRDKGDVSGGPGTWQMESFTKGNGFFAETNKSSIGEVTFRQFTNVPGHIADVSMDALNLMVRDGSTSTQLRVMQDITDTAFGLTRNRITLTPRDPLAPPITDFGVYPNYLIHVDQTTTGPNGFNSTVGFDVGQQITPNQTF